MLVPTSPAMAATRTLDCSLGGSFSIVDHVVTASTNDCAGTVTIPADVIEVGYTAFSHRNLTGVTFEAGSQLTTLSNYSFEFTNISSVELPNGLVTIASGAFTFAKFTTISIPGTVEFIYANAFYGTDLESVVFRTRSTSNLYIDPLAFLRSANLGSLTFLGPTRLDESPGAIAKTDYNWLGWSTSADGSVVTYPYSITNPNGATLYPRWVRKVITEAPCSLAGTFRTEDHVIKSSTDDCAGAVTIPADVVQIDSGAFSRKNVTSVTFAPGSQLTLISEYAFEFTNLTSIELPDSVKTIAHGAFTEAKFSTISLSGNIESIQGSPFYNSSLQSVVFQPRIASTLSINPDAFIYSRRLSSVTFRGPIQLDDAPFRITKYANDWIGWSTSRGGSEATFPVTAAGSEDLVLYPLFLPRTYVATYDSNGGTQVSPGNIVGGEIEFPEAPTRAGYTFAGWFSYLSSTEQVSRWDFDNGGTFSAKWNPTSHAVNLDSTGGSQVAPVSFFTDGEISAAPEEPSRRGYSFTGWAATENGPTIWFPYSPGGVTDVTLYATWVPLTPTISAGTAPNSQLATIPAGLTDATIPGTEKLPSVRFVLPLNSSEAVVTLIPTVNSVSRLDTPFVVSSSTKFVDIEITGVTGSVTVCLDGAPTDHLYHFTGGAWVDLPQRSYVNGQVCGVTSSFSPFAASAPAPYKPHIKVNPTASGKAQQDTYLVATTGTWSADPVASHSYQWYRCDKSVTAGRTSFTPAMKCTKVTGATKSRYKVSLADQGKHLTSLVKASNSIGSSLASTKSILVPMATQPVAKSLPRISGSAVKGNLVTVNTGVWSANPAATTTQQWYRCDKSVRANLADFTKSMKCKKIPGATRTQYTIAIADQDLYLTAMVTAKNSQGVVVTSAKSVHVPGTKPTAKGLAKVSGSLVVGGVLRATDGTWSAIPEATTSLQWYRCDAFVSAGRTAISSAAGCTKINGATNSRYTLRPSDEGKHLTVVVKAKNSYGSGTSHAKSTAQIRPQVKVTKTP